MASTHLREIVTKVLAASALGGAVAILVVAATRASIGGGDAQVHAAIADAAHVEDAGTANALDAADALASDADADAVQAEEDVAVAPTPEAEICAKYRAAEEARVAKIVAEAAKESDDEAAAGASYTYPLWCKPTPHGAWADSLERAKVSFSSDGVAVEGTWRLVHLGADGERVSIGDESAGSFDYSVGSGPHHDHDLEVIADYDDDGEPELHVADGNYYSEGDNETAHRIYTFKNGAILPYAPASAFEIYDIQDVDHDGRQDILVSLDTLSGYTTCLGDHNFSAFAWLAHSTKTGTFDRVDAEAKKAVAEKCAQALKKLSRTPGELDLSKYAEAIVCARVAGRSPDAIRAELAKGCDSFEDRMAMCGFPDPIPNPDRRCPEWFKTLPDIVLPD